MPTTIEDKISLFTKVLIERIESDYTEKQKKLMSYYESRKLGIIKDYEEKTKAAIDDATKNAEIKKQQMISKAKSDMHLAVLKQRREFTERIMDEVRKEAEAFGKTPEYVEFLRQAIKKVSSQFTDNDFVSYSFSRNDIKKHRDIILNTITLFRSEGNFKIEEANNIIGGVFARDGDGSMEVDLTVNSIIEESRKLVVEILSSKFNERW